MLAEVLAVQRECPRRRAWATALRRSRGPLDVVRVEQAAAALCGKWARAESHQESVGDVMQDAVGGPSGWGILGHTQRRFDDQLEGTGRRLRGTIHIHGGSVRGNNGQPARLDGDVVGHL